MLLLAGREPTSGTVTRPGAVGLGKLGGTAVVLQHPESQVLGTRVADDVVWGLPPGTKIDVDKLLREVGLDELAERDTGSLSGGELQRLALAAALARETAMLIADEVTTMVDQQGRDALLRVLSGLTKRHRTALVHITHYNNEAESADRTINLSDSPDNMGMVAAGTRRCAHRGSRRHPACADPRADGCRPPIRHRDPVGQDRAARRQLGSRAGRRPVDPRRQWFGEVDAGVDHGRVDDAYER